jgi:uncharacterized Zn-finger protein
MSSTVVQKIQKTSKSELHEATSIDQQFYSYSLFNSQLIAHQTAAFLSTWPFHNIPYPSSLFNTWPLIPPVPFETTPLISPILNHHENNNNNINNNNNNNNTNYMETNEMKLSELSKNSFASTPLSSPSHHSSDSLESIDHQLKKEHHQQQHIKTPKIFTCNVCDKKFGYKHVLQNHEKTHTGEKSYACSVCNKHFRRDHHLKVHMRLHTNERPYHCTYPQCNRQFVQVANLRRHMKTHNESIKDNEKTNIIKAFDMSHKNYSNHQIQSYPEQIEPEDLSVHRER